MKELGCRGEFLTFRASAARENIQLVPVRQCEAQRRAAVGLVDAPRWMRRRWLWWTA
jgi:ATP-dependent DNA helicase RecQ